MSSRVARQFAALLAIAALALAFSFGALAQESTPASGGHDGHDGAATPGSGACAAIGAAPSAADTMMHGETMGSPMAGMTMPVEFDLMFIDMMIPHHQGAIEMANIALERAEHEEVRALAEMIISDQQAEIDQMLEWRERWYPGAEAMPMDQMLGMFSGMMGDMDGMMATPDTGMGVMDHMATGMMDPRADARNLCNATGSFDEAFLRMMIPHHQGAIGMAQIARQEAVHPELQELAQTIIAEQEAEIAQMQAWLTAWYGATPVPSPMADH